VDKCECRHETFLKGKLSRGKSHLIFMVIKVKIIFQEERLTHNGVSALNLPDVEYYL
jgi:hypothetical protein